MQVLALDTSTRPGSVALLRDADVLAAASGDAAQTHAERLPAEIVHLLAAAGLDLPAIDAFGVAAGPGSFTGLRIGIATIQGLAFALNRPVVAVSCLDALALVAAEAANRSGDRSPLVAAWMDAQRSEVFAALYELRRADTGPRVPSPTIIDGPVSERPETVLKRWHPMIGDRAIVVAGDGVGRYRSLLMEHLGDRLQPVEPLPPLAPVIGRMTIDAMAAGQGVAPHAIRPIYVRRPDAELARDRQHLTPRTDPSDVR